MPGVTRGRKVLEKNGKHVKKKTRIDPITMHLVGISTCLPCSYVMPFGFVKPFGHDLRAFTYHGHNVDLNDI